MLRLAIQYLAVAATIGLTGFVLATGTVAEAQETIVPVPQGSAIYPAMGQIECLEKEGSGRYCAATYECADASGELWSDMANHDGRRAVQPDHPVATRRDCSIQVDGKAAARWFYGYRAGRDEPVVGMTSAVDAQRPVQVVRREGGSSSRTMLDYLLARMNVTVPEIVEERCGHIDEGHIDRRHCDGRLLAGVLGMSRTMLTPTVRCAIEAGYEMYAGAPRLGSFTDLLFEHPHIVTLHYVIREGRSQQRYAEDAYNYHERCLAEALSELDDLGLTYDDEYTGYYQLAD